MAVLVDRNTRVMTQGFTGTQGTFHASQGIAYGSTYVGGTTPGKGGTMHPELNLPVFDTVAECVARTQANASGTTFPRPSPRIHPGGERRRLPLILCLTRAFRC